MPALRGVTNDDRSFFYAQSAFSWSPVCYQRPRNYRLFDEGACQPEGGVCLAARVAESGFGALRGGRRTGTRKKNAGGCERQKVKLQGRDKVRTRGITSAWCDSVFSEWPVTLATWSQASFVSAEVP